MIYLLLKDGLNKSTAASRAKQVANKQDGNWAKVSQVIHKSKERLRGISGAFDDRFVEFQSKLCVDHPSNERCQRTVLRLSIRDLSKRRSLSICWRLQ